MDNPVQAKLGENEIPIHHPNSVGAQLSTEIQYLTIGLHDI